MHQTPVLLICRWPRYLQKIYVLALGHIIRMAKKLGVAIVAHESVHDHTAARNYVIAARQACSKHAVTSCAFSPDKSGRSGRQYLGNICYMYEAQTQVLHLHNLLLDTHDACLERSI